MGNFSQVCIMINVLINDNDALFRQGMKQYLTELFSIEFDKQVNFSMDFSDETVSEADVIVMELCKGENYTCTPELRSRKKSIIIGIVDSEFEMKKSLTRCTTDIIFIQRCEPLSVIHQKVINLWKLYNQPGGKLHCGSCCSCPHLELSPHQVKIMARIYNEKTVHQIAKELNVSYKTIASHKYVVMNKFNLSNDYELINFLSKLKEKTIHPNYFREYLNRFSGKNGTYADVILTQGL
ncbi:MAG: helix-turn-helix transcriptional regulator [Serratia sp. (in: enterobacteria)]|uniref:helix-turn-helix transcriptional regulator n=1 Tax=Serratia sp. (in: enterobacteria) TaxID=616 RepID=UPI003F367D49